MTTKKKVTLLHSGAPSDFQDFEISLSPEAPRKISHLYAFVGVHTRRVKIGRARNVYMRFRQVQSHCCDDLLVVGYAYDMGYLEPAVHTAFAAHRLHGEWFSPHVTAEIAAHVDMPGSLIDSSVSFERWLDRTFKLAGD